MENNQPNYAITVSYNQHLQCWTATDNLGNTVGFGQTDMEAFKDYLTKYEQN